MDFNHFKKEESELMYRGIFTEVYQRNFTRGRYEYVVLPDTVRVIGVTKKGKILIIREKLFSYDKLFHAMPGGAVEKGERPIETAKRELNEETGFDSDEIELWFSQNYSQTIISRKYFFIARNCAKKNSANLESTEDIKTIEADPAEFTKLVLCDSFKHIELQNKIYKMKFDNSYRQEFVDRFSIDLVNV